MRRTLARHAADLASWLILAAAASLSAGCGTPCPSGQIKCSQGCVDLQSDFNSCGACSHVCPQGASCNAGACGCPGGTTLCGGACVDLQSDSSNCGACGQACGAGSCVSGACVCDTTPATVANCGGNPACIDTAGDAKNCGGCGMACPLANETCSGGTCGCAAPDSAECPSANPTACVDEQSDARNCGGCGVTCLTGGDCDGGVCGCPAPRVGCPSANPTACVDQTSDAKNCGGCGVACPTGQTCQSSVCCATTVCGGACIDTTTDIHNCGACGKACSGATPACVGGACCGSGTTVVCDHMCCGGGNSCCANNACQTQHFNALGGPQGATFFDCNAVDSPAAAQAAAQFWSPGGAAPANESTFTGQSCFAWQTHDGTQCAVYCASGSAAPGLVKLTLASAGCALPFVGDSSSQSWE